LIQYPKQITKIYAVDLIGAGFGSMGIIVLLFYVFPSTALLIISLSALIAAFIAVKEIDLFSSINNKEMQLSKHKLVKVFYLLFFITAFFILYSFSLWQLKISPYKDLPKVLNISGAQIIEQQSSPLGLLSIVKSPQIPFRFAPGLSLYNTQEPLEQLGLFSDASNMTAITRYPDKTQDLAYLDQVTSALPYHLNNIKRLLIVGAGGGSDILQALFHKTKHIDALELNYQTINFLKKNYSQYSGFLYSNDFINIYAEDVRGFLSKQTINKFTPYNLIQISLIDSFNASTSGLYALQSSYIYTIEALQIYLQNLSLDGYLAISRWIKTPPRDSIKMLATAIKALEKNLIPWQEIPQHLVLIRAWQTSTLLIKKIPFTLSEINKLKQFCQQRAFDVVWYAGIKSSEVNYFNQFRQPWLYQAANSLLFDPKLEFIKEYKYDIEPATDDKPFFHHFFKWSGFKELLSLGEQGGFALLEMGYIVLLLTLLLAVFSSFILILLPLIVFHFRRKSKSTKEQISLSISERSRLFVYFFAIGLAFLFIEIAMMQKFILFLYHPIFSIPVILTAFMIFAGLGSISTKKLLSHFPPKQVLGSAIMMIILLVSLGRLLVVGYLDYLVYQSMGLLVLL